MVTTMVTDSKKKGKETTEPVIELNGVQISSVRIFMVGTQVSLAIRLELLLRSQL